LSSCILRKFLKTILWEVICSMNTPPQGGHELLQVACRATSRSNLGG
jgi:hypothetical protein